MDILGKKLAESVLDTVSREITFLKKSNRSISLAVVLVGKNKASVNFVQKKEKKAIEAGIDFNLFHLPKKTSEESLVAKIKDIQHDPKITGLIVQLPLPAHINPRTVLDTVDPCKDVDCLTTSNLGRLMTGIPLVKPPTASAIEFALDNNGVQIEGSNVVIVGRGELVGKPLSILLTARSATVTVCHSKTRDLSYFTENADILVTGVGKPGLITDNMVKKGSVVVDTGTSFKDGKLMGDVDYEAVQGKAGLITPVPGGIGPITVSKLLENCVRLAKLCGQ